METSLMEQIYPTIVLACLKYFCLRSKVKVTRSKPNFLGGCFVSRRNPLDEYIFFNQIDTKYVE